ncbi:hypothetical protein Tco_0790226 [Tanacetum coccineum]
MSRRDQQVLTELDKRGDLPSIRGAGNNGFVNPSDASQIMQQCSSRFVVQFWNSRRGRQNKYLQVLVLSCGLQYGCLVPRSDIGLFGLRSSKRGAEVGLDHEGSKKQKTNEASESVQEQPDEEEKELPQEDLQQMMMVVLVEEVYVEAKFDRDDLVKIWDLVKERFSTIEPRDDKEKELWVVLKRLFEPDSDDTLWKLQRSKLKYKFQDQENSEDIFSFGSALEDFIFVVFILDRNIVKGRFQPERPAQGLEVGSIRRIQGLDMVYWGFLGVGTTFDIFQNIHILYLEYGVLSLSGYGVLSFIPLCFGDKSQGPQNIVILDSVHEKSVPHRDRLIFRNEVLDDCLCKSRIIDFLLFLRVFVVYPELKVFLNFPRKASVDDCSKEELNCKMAEQDIPPPTITAMKIPIIRKGEYDIWSMRKRQYICHTNHNLWDVIVNGDLEEEPAPTTGETSAPPAPKTAKQLAARRNQERVKSILLLAIPDEYLLKFHNVADAKSLWEAIKSRFSGNVESKKMQKNVLKHLFEIFSTSSNESLDKAYDRRSSRIFIFLLHLVEFFNDDFDPFVSLLVSFVSSNL